MENNKLVKNYTMSSSDFGGRNVYLWFDDKTTTNNNGNMGYVTNWNGCAGHEVERLQNIINKMNISNEIKEVFYNPPYTTILWKDGSKSFSKAMDGDKFDFFIGFCIAVTNHVFESKSKRNKIVDQAVEYYNGRKKNGA